MKMRDKLAMARQQRSYSEDSNNICAVNQTIILHGAKSVITVFTIVSHWSLTTEVLFINLVNPTGYVMHHQFNIQQLYVLPTLYLCVLYLSENKQRLVPLTA